MDSIRHLLREVFNYDFAKCKSSSDFLEHFFEVKLSIADLKQVHALVHASGCDIGGKTIPSAMLVGDAGKTPPVMILAQLHGNEPAGLAGILLAFALAEAKMLNQQVLVAIGNPLASEQYFSAYSEAPRARQELRDGYRCGLGEGGKLLPDMNRIPTDFMTRPPDNHHTRRAQELFHLGSHVSGILDIHSARGNMLCITDHKNDMELKNSPIRAVLIGLADAIAAHSSSGSAQVKTLKTILSPLPNIRYQVGIEAGRHETEDAPLFASMFAHAFLHAIGASKAAPYTPKKETGEFDCYHVQPKWTYGDLVVQGNLLPEDKLFMAAPCMSADAIPKRADRVIVKKKDGAFQVQTIMQYIVAPAGDITYAVYQYDEMEMLHEGAVVAVAVPSGAVLKAPKTAAGIFFSKCASLYDQDPAVGPWPLAASARGDVKFCYPCIVKKEKLSL
ncbi:MAG: hypothetical protein SFX19_03145 [Alphaproteobacteria bacterium]|nr:hypothetical protein [Alphaproteobacteria bacterium]